MFLKNIDLKLIIMAGIMFSGRYPFFFHCLGIAIMLIERYVPTNFDDCDDCRLYYNNILAWVCSGFSLAALISVISLFLCQMFFGSRKVDKTTISVDVNIDMKYQFLAPWLRKSLLNQRKGLFIFAIHWMFKESWGD